MRILFYSAYPGFSGSHAMALQVAVACHRAGYEVVAGAPDSMEFLTRADERGLPTLVIPAPPELLQFDKAVLGRSPIGRARLVAGKLVPYNLQARRFLRARGIDVVYAAQERAVLQIGLGCRLAGVPLVWHIQSGLLSGSTTMHRVARWLSTSLVCVSEAVADSVRRVLGSSASDQLRIVPNGIPDRDPPSERGEGESDVVRVLFAGNVIPQKGVHHLLEALGRLPRPQRDRVRLRIAGSTADQEYVRFLESIAARHSISDRVALLGHREDVHELIDESDLIVCPSVERERLTTPARTWEVDGKEGFGLVALEAMRVGKPVVASDTYGLREVVVDGETGLRVPPGDPAALAGAMERLVADAALRARLGASGRARYEERFSEETMTGKFLEEFEALSRRFDSSDPRAESAS